jgi:uncharacterized protein
MASSSTAPVRYDDRLRRACTLVILLVLALCTLPAAALSLPEARSRGLVGETPRGYIAPVGSPSPEVAELVNQVNAARRSHYAEIASRTGSMLEQVEVLSAREIRRQVPDGTYLMSPDGSWIRR